MTSILFVCTGNIFRSMTADFALNKLLSSNNQFIVSSAGTRDQPELTVRSDVAAYLQSKGLDVSNHRRRTIDQEIMEQSDIVVAMNEDHQQTLRQRFGRQCPLFTEACGNAPTPLPDVDDLFADGDYYTPGGNHTYKVNDRYDHRPLTFSADTIADQRSLTDCALYRSWPPFFSFASALRGRTRWFRNQMNPHCGDR